MKKNWQIPESQVTDKSIYMQRRTFIQSIGLGGALMMGAGSTIANVATTRSIATPEVAVKPRPNIPPWLQQKVAQTATSHYTTSETLTPYEYVTQYNNFYEFGTDKGDPYENAQAFKTDPWQVEIKGEAENTGTYTLEDILKPYALEERIYRLRCVEAWSMVVPWIGFPLADLLQRFKPTANAKYVRFKTLVDPEQMPGQASRFKAIDYPYVEGLRIDEAMNELAFMSVGLYGEVLPPQNGAPLRLVIPWKYGFKSIKSIVSIEFTSRQPTTTWVAASAREYGFYANVNPNVNHPRWSQATERRLPSSLFSPNRINTLMFNGYAEQVAHLYTDLDLRQFF